MKHTAENPGTTFFTVSALDVDPTMPPYFYNVEDAQAHADEFFAKVSYKIDEFNRSNGEHVRTEAHIKAGR